MFQMKNINSKKGKINNFSRFEIKSKQIFINPHMLVKKRSIVVHEDIFDQFNNIVFHSRYISIFK